MPDQPAVLGLSAGGLAASLWALRQRQPPSTAGPSPTGSEQGGLTGAMSLQEQLLRAAAGPIHAGADRLRRSPVYARRGMVSSSQPLATEAGLRILRAGGNAVDAAVAVAAALAVTTPAMTGLGGDMFMLFWDTAAKEVKALNGSGRAPEALTVEAVREAMGVGAEGMAYEGTAGVPDPKHVHCVTVPGACAGWCDAIGPRWLGSEYATPQRSAAGSLSVFASQASMSITLTRASAAVGFSKA